VALFLFRAGKTTINHNMEAVMSVPAAYLGVILIWSTTPLAVKWSGEGPGFLFGVTGRMVIGTALCLLMLKLFRVAFPWHRRARRAYLAASLGIYGAMMCVYWGAQFIPSGVIALIFGVSPIVTSLLAALWLGERTLTPLRLAGMALGLAGLATIFAADGAVSTAQWYGYAAIALAVLLHATSAVWVKRIGGDLPVLAVNGGGLSVAVALYLLTWVSFDGHWPEALAPRSGASILYLGVLGTAVGFNLFFYVLKHVSAATVALVTLITPVTALMLGQLLNGETIDSHVWTAAAFILGGLGIYQWGDDVAKRALGTLARCRNGA
jgi:drug/metabolite transporter (DMT)-like permease